MKQLLTALLVLFACIANAQSRYVQGTVVNFETGLPLEGASVFINNGSGGTLTDREGKFSVPTGSQTVFELVISFVSYQTIVVNITPENVAKKFLVKMSPKPNELKEVIVGAVEKDGWKKWGATFLTNFIGISENALRCSIKNPEVLRFRVNRQTGLLTVFASDKLQIINKGLGYVVNFQLEEFTYDQRRGIVLYTGYSYFDPLQTGRYRQNTRWIENRKAAYSGSLTRLMRSIYKKTVVDEGFELRTLIRIYKKDSSTRRYYDHILANNFTDFDTARFSVQWVKESTLQAPVIYLLAKQPLELDSIRWIDPVSKQCFINFNACIRVVYKNEMESREFVGADYNRKALRMQSSILYLIGNRAISVQENGLFFQPLDLFTERYFAFEKIGELLPSDYRFGD